MRRVEDLKDDEIVDAVAAYGKDGFDIRHLDDLATALDVAPTPTETSELDERIYRMYHPGKRIRRNDDVYRLSNTEWGSRLAGKTASEITAALDGDR